MGKNRTSIEEIRELVKLCRKESMDLRPRWDSRRPFIILEYVAYEPTKQPAIMRFDTLTEAKEYLKDQWRQAVAYRQAMEDK